MHTVNLGALSGILVVLTVDDAPLPGTNYSESVIHSLTGPPYHPLYHMLFLPLSFHIYHSGCTHNHTFTTYQYVSIATHLFSFLQCTPLLCCCHGYDITWLHYCPDVTMVIIWPCCTIVVMLPWLGLWHWCTVVMILPWGYMMLIHHDCCDVTMVMIWPCCTIVIYVTMVMVWCSCTIVVMLQYDI